MKQIEFGYANEQNPRGSWEGMGIKPGLLLNKADYYGAINYRGSSYVVAKVTEDKFGNYPQLLGKFVVRPAIADIFPDGSGTIFLDQEQSQDGANIERTLNDEKLRDKITGPETLLALSDQVKIAPLFACLELSQQLSATAIRHEEFAKKKVRLERSTTSMCGMCEKIEEYVEYIKNAEQSQVTSGYRR